MVVQAEIKYTRLDNGHWVIESTTQLPISLIRQNMQFIDRSGKKHDVSKIVKSPDTHPTAPYYYFVEVITEN